MATFSKLLGSTRLLSISTKSTMLGFGIYIFAAFIAQAVLINNVISEDTKFFQASSEGFVDGVKPLLEQKRLAEACDYLDKNQKSDLFSFYIIQAKGNALCAGPASSVSELNVSYLANGQYVVDGNYGHISSNVGPFIVTIGSLQNTWATRFAFLKSKGLTLIFGPLLVFLVIFLVGKLIQIPFSRMSRSLQKSGNINPEHRSSFIENLAESKEAALVRAASVASETIRDELVKDNRLFEETIGISIFREAKQHGSEGSRRFMATFLRFDVNNYTKIYLTDAETVQKIIFDLTVESDEIVRRYGGLQYDFAGDEYVIAFKDSELSRSQAIALGCIRDIFKKIETFYPNNYYRDRVTLKASLHHSENVFFKLPNGFYFRGLNLIHTQRYLTTVDIKTENKLVVNAEEVPGLSQLARFNGSAKYELKGLGEVVLSDQVSFASLNDLIASGCFDLITYFRSDEDLATLLKLLCEPLVLESSKKMILEHLKAVPVRRSGNEIASAWGKALLHFDENWAENKFLISSLLVAGMNLIPSENWNETYTNILVLLKCLADSRSCGAALSLLAAKVSWEDYYKNEGIFLEAYTGTSFRPEGDKLVIRAKQSLSDEIFSAVQDMIASQDPNEVATGVYAASSIIRRYRSENPIILSQFLVVPKIVSSIAELRSHENLMVKNRAQIEYRALTGDSHDT